MRNDKYRIKEISTANTKIQIQKSAIPTCKCQNRNVKMSPIPTPMIQATIMNVSNRKLEKAWKWLLKQIVNCELCPHLEHSNELGLASQQRQRQIIKRQRQCQRHAPWKQQWTGACSSTVGRTPSSSPTPPSATVALSSDPNPGRGRKKGV